MCARSYNLLISSKTLICALTKVQLHCSPFSCSVETRFSVGTKEKAHQLACLHLVLCTYILYVFSAILLRCILPPFSPLSKCPLGPWNSYIIMGHWWTSEKQITQRETEWWRCGPGLAQPSMDYDVDSNPEGWTERLRVKGLCGLWAIARWMRYRQPWSLYFEC